MLEIAFLFSNPFYLDLPVEAWEWIVWVIFLTMLVFLAWKWKGYNLIWTKQRMVLAGIMVLLVPITSMLIPGIRLPSAGMLPSPMLPKTINDQVIMLFSALPWVLAAGFHGPLVAMGLAMITGWFLSLWGMHHIFFPLELSLLSLIYAVAINQPFRTPFFRLLRHPFIAAFLIALIYPIVYIPIAITVSQGVLSNRIDYVLTHFIGIAPVVWVPLLIAGLFAEGIARMIPVLWAQKGVLIPSPAERSLEARFVYGIAIAAITLGLALIVGDWFVAGRVARQLVEKQISTNAQIASESVPFFLESGQNLIQQFAKEIRSLDQSPNILLDSLAESMRRIPYFSELILLDEQGNPIASYPPKGNQNIGLTQDERMGIELARNGVLTQFYVIPPIGNSPAACISFMSVVYGPDQQFEGILLGRSDLYTNPFSQPLLNAIRSVKEFNGEGMLLDDEGRILFHTDPNRVMDIYTGKIETDQGLYDDVAQDGTRQLVLYRQVIGRPWAVLLSIPARHVQNQALVIATPIAVLVFFSSVVGFVLLRLGIRVVTSSLEDLAFEAERLAQGNLDHPLFVEGEDEISRLRRSFEKMRVRLKARLDELNRLLIVSQGVASTLDIAEALTPVLESALLAGATAARVVLRSVDPLIEYAYKPRKLRFGAGKSSDIYSNLDEQILALTSQQERIIISNLSRPRFLELPEGIPHPQSLIGLSLRHKGDNYGALWVAFDQPRTFSEEEVRFLTVLARQAAMAAANARLFQTAEIGRRRLESVLSSSPDPILVISNQQRLMLANPSAAEVFGFSIETCQGAPIEEIISHSKLIGLLKSSLFEQQSEEITLPDGRVYLAIVSLIRTEGNPIGRICMMRDVTHFKRIDELKSEFVSTVSHDLRSPLQLIRGYASMIQMVGGLSEQQSGYLQQIITNVENMSRLISNLLDLGRIEAGVGLQLERVSAREVAEEVYSELQVEAAQKHIRFDLDFPPINVPLIEADRSLLRQALRNLVENAIKYTDSGGWVRIGLRIHSEAIIFEVIDNGIGISTADQPRLFEKFYRIHRKDSGREHGSGLGLAIVKSIAERHGGKVWVESQLGKGSKFFLAIPIQHSQRVGEDSSRN